MLQTGLNLEFPVELHRQRRSAVGDDPFRLAMTGDRCGEERARRGNIATARDVDVDDLAVSVDGAVHVPPHAGHVDVGLVDEPASPDSVAARSRRVDDQRCEPLHPAVNRDVVHRDAAFGEQFFQVSVREPEPQIPADRQQDDLRREPEPGER